MSAPIENDPLNNPSSESFFFSPFSLLFACTNLLVFFYLAGDVEVPIEPTLEEYVNTPAFDHQCSEKARELAALSSDESGDSDEDGSWSSDDDSDSVSSATAVESTPYKVPKMEANLYYAGVGPKGRGPKLIYRTSDDKFEEPDGPEAYTRLMRVIAVPDSHEFGQNGRWDTVRDKVRRWPFSLNATISFLTNRSF
jgi:hypothetical protein